MSIDARLIKRFAAGPESEPFELIFTSVPQLVSLCSSGQAALEETLTLNCLAWFRSP